MVICRITVTVSKETPAADHEPFHEISEMRSSTDLSPLAPLTDSRLATLCAEEAHNAFRDYAARFDEITQRARERFLAHDLKGSYADSAERLHLYGHVLADLTTQ